ncbi:hypothetical protein A2U01_0088926, partial [Trifolium medium]|nr:hypothetical protein [Trifolium medium]
MRLVDSGSSADIMYWDAYIRLQNIELHGRLF